MDKIKIMNEFNRWRNNVFSDPDLIEELQSIANSYDEISDRFYKNLEFGTAGMRGELGVGTNRMNVYVVGKVTQALSQYLQTLRANSTVVIGYDNRIKSRLFAKISAEILAANGIKVKIFKTLKPVPLLSYAVRFLKCDGGVMITASHNPAEYNGYKIFGADGCQIIQNVVDVICKFLDEIDIFSDVKRVDFDKGLSSGLISYCDDEIEQNFLICVENSLMQSQILYSSDLNLVYTPLNGTGLEPVERMMKKFKIEGFHVVEAQKDPDGNFSTCKSPNPENFAAFEQALIECEKHQPDIVIATDPDCDRIGVMVRSVDLASTYKLLNGNQLGVLMLNYLCLQRLNLKKMPFKPLMIKTIVSTPMADYIAKYYGVNCENVLTGFKYIGAKINNLAELGEQDRFIFGFEESQGYLAGSYVRDKDGVFAAMLICEMVVFYKLQGKTLIDVLNDLYVKFGFFKSEVRSYEFKGADGTDKMASIMDKFRNFSIKNIGEFKIIEKLDYLISKKINLLTGNESVINLPKSNVLEFNLDFDFKIVVRISGTEPMIKVYYHVKGHDAIEAAELIQNLQDNFSKCMEA